MMPMRANIVGPPERRDQDQGFYGRLPFLDFVLGFRKLGYVGAGIFKGDKLTARQRYGIIKRSFPTPIANGASPSCRIRS